jgi:hypothetical protein
MPVCHIVLSAVPAPPALGLVIVLCSSHHAGWTANQPAVSEACKVAKTHFGEEEEEEEEERERGGGYSSCVLYEI